MLFATWKTVGGGARTLEDSSSVRQGIISATVYAAGMEGFNECEGAQRRESEIVEEGVKMVE